MTDIAPYPMTDPMTAQARGISVTNALLAQQQTQQRQQTLQTAGNALTGGDYTGAANDLYKSGDLQGGLQFDTLAKGQVAAAADADTAQKQQLAKYTADTATRLLAFHQSLVNQPGADPNAATQRTLAAFDQTAPQLKAMGETDDDIAQVRAHIAADPQGTFTALGAGAAKELGYEVKEVNGQLVAIDKSTGKARLIASSSPMAGGATGAPTAPAIGEDQANPDASFLAPASVSPAIAPAGPSGAPAGGQADPDAVWAAIKHQESGGEKSPGTAVGPDTPYGNALGSTQMLPATAESMARKLGIAWNPAYMRENTPQALAYQDKIGRAYFDEGLAKNNGDPAAAAAYYFGGPDMALHGPKTAAYVQAVMARANPQPYQVAANGATPPPPSDPNVGQVDANGVLHLAPARPKWVSDGKGALIDPATGDTKKDESFHGADDEPLSDDAITQNATRFAMTGQLPPLGVGKAAAADKRKVMNKASELIKEWGIEPSDWVTGLAQVKVAQGSLAQISKTTNSIQAAENAVTQNMNGVVLPLMSKANPGGIPLLNRYVMAAKDQVFGDPDVKAYDNALHTVADEYSRVMTTANGSGGGTTSDSARTEAYRRLSTAQTPDQVVKTFRTLQQEMANRRDALLQQQHALVGQIQSAGKPMGFQDQPVAPASGGAAPVHVSSLQQAMALPPGTVFITPDGRQKVR